MSVIKLQTAATVDGNGAAVSLDTFSTAIVEIVETAGGTATVSFNGAFDGNFTNAYPVGYQKVNATASPARAVTGISVTANMANAYKILDVYPFLQAVISSSAGGSTVTVRAYLT